VLYEQEPIEGLDSGNPILEAYLSRELRRITEAFLGVEFIQLPVLHVAPDKPRNGMIILVDGADFDPGSGRGFYGRSNGAWVFLG